MENKKGGLSPLHLSMMALGTVIGGSFFLGSSIGIKAAGPSIILVYLLVGILVYFILYALSEMTVADPAPGSFRTFAERAFGPGVGFVVGWVYWTGLILAMSSEATAVSVFLRIWFGNIPIPILGSGIIVLITVLNLLGAEKLSKLESSLSAIKLLAIAGFIVIAIAIIIGILPNIPSTGLGEIQREALVPSGISGVLGSALIVMFTYAGFEVIGLAASEAENPHVTIPKAITYTVVGLVGLYSIAIAVLLPLINTNKLTGDASPFVLALESRGISWAARVMNIILVIAILSTMLAAMFGLGRMLRSLAEEGHAPRILKDTGEIPYKGIIFSGISMLIGLGLGFLLPKQVYIFLVSSGGFSLLFTYFIILITHNRFRKNHGCPPKGKCRFPGYPYTSWISSIAVIVIIASMPFIEGQGAGLLAGLFLVIFYSSIYVIVYKKSFKVQRE
ncbi:GABA permease [Clostridium homopropionicum DSM 5847]|uniref:GABA permease n=1 Tax=Clostridium homopropionicum DSM 5847 TaxID=1121318 RepID=A0A0L6ZAG5_9CLOT|nr:amino acid permease [Clostridium homopropionicum]KOA19964.1 GABA permease [Clostridium homopropionicum DSM 5847]SFG63432.1 amino acid transporter, AAT family [Clostridium homopropionicum]